VTAWDFSQRLPEFARNLLHKPGLQTWQELNGYDCIDISERDERLQKAIDRINSQYGNKAVKVATQVLNTDKTLTKKEKLSPCYTTNLRNILVLKC
jgi:hypothetical protein